MVADCRIDATEGADVLDYSQMPYGTHWPTPEEFTLNSLYGNDHSVQTGITGVNVVFKKGDRIHREDAPASYHTGGTVIWYSEGRFDRKDGPAIMSKHGQWWFSNGSAKRDNNLPTAITNDGFRFCDGALCHREDGGPSTCDNGIMTWYHGGVLHREDGPAVIGSAHGIPIVLYYLDGKPVTYKEWQLALGR